MSQRRHAPRLLACLALGCILAAACVPGKPPSPPAYSVFELEPGETYGPTLAPPISIRLGQSVVTAHGPVGPTDRPEGPPAIWEGHALSLEPDRERNRTLFFFVEGDDLQSVTLQLNDHPVIVETNPGAYLSGEFSMVRWAQDYSLRVTAENRTGLTATAAIHVTGEDARLEGARSDPLRMRMVRLGESSLREVRGIGFRSKLYRHYWPHCSGECDLTTPGGALAAMISGPADTLLLLIDREFPYLAFGLSYWPAPNYLIVAIPVRQERLVEIAALSRDGDLAQGRWDKPST